MKITKPKTFTVIRKLWYRGNDYRGSKLRRKDDKKQCCLGFYARACGLKPIHITDVCSPSSIGDYLPPLPSVVRKESGQRVNTNTCQKMMEVNDAPSISESSREIRLRRLFRRIGVTIKFK